MSEISLYEHNKIALERIEKKFLIENVAAIVHATGTGKSYIALNLILNNPNKKFLYIVPSLGIIEHLEEIINGSDNLKERFKNVKFSLYQSFINYSKEDMLNEEFDYLILDEFHHIGAPIWGQRVKCLIETHPKAKILGMTAYTVRDRNTSYERDMANPDTDELFSNKIVSRFDICDGILDGVLPNVVYKSCYENLLILENEIEKENVKKLTQEDKEIIKDIKRRIHEAPTSKEVVKKSLRKNGKYIYFCPPSSQKGVNDIETIIEEFKTWLSEMGLTEEDYEIYKTTSDMGLLGKKNRDNFYKDLDTKGNLVNNKLRIMFAINQYNEGIHAPGVDGVIMGRGTCSDIVFFEQLGRALSVRGSSPEERKVLENLSINELKELCKSRDIDIIENTTKDQLINKLLSPVVIDLAGNFEYIKELENNLKNRVRERSVRKDYNQRIMNIRSYNFDISMENEDLYEMLLDLRNRMISSWDYMYELAKKYYEHHGNLEVPQRFKTINGVEYDKDGMNLGTWISIQRRNKNLTKERKEKLLLIAMRFETQTQEELWENMYELAKRYYDYHGNLDISERFKTKDGINYDEKGLRLGAWINTQRHYKKLKPERKEKLLLLDMRFETKSIDDLWEYMYELAKKYYEHHGNLDIPQKFKTKDGMNYDENGVSLGKWLYYQKYYINNNKLSNEKENKLITIGLNTKIKSNEEIWEDNYNIAKKYYEYYGNLEVPQKFKTKDGVTYDEEGMNLGTWISTQRQNKNLSKQHQEKLKLIGMRFQINNIQNRWNMMYELAKKYYEYYKNLEVPQKFKTKDGVKYDENGMNLGMWISTQRQNKNIVEDRKKLLTAIGMNFEVKDLDRIWEEKYDLAKKYYNHYGNLNIPQRFKTKNGVDYDEDGIALGVWLNTQRCIKNINKERKQKLISIGLNFESDYLKNEWDKMYELAKQYFETYGNLEVPHNFSTKDGTTFNTEGVNLGYWITYQRKNKNISLEHRQKLLLIGMRFFTKKLEEICNGLNIDKLVNFDILKNTDYKEFIYRCKYLIKNDINILLENGRLNDAFSLNLEEFDKLFNKNSIIQDNKGRKL